MAAKATSKKTTKKNTASKKASVTGKSKTKPNKLAAPEIKVNPNKGKTMGNMLGEIVWLMTQSQGHKHYALSDLEWMVMPALLLEQYRIFRNGTQPVGVALWAYLTPEAEEKLQSGAGRLRPDEWAINMKLDPKEGATGSTQGALWLVDLISPFHSLENKMADKMLVDLMKGPFKDKKFKFHQTDPKTGQRKVMELGGNLPSDEKTKGEETIAQ